jgi:hypothetical protein
MGDAAFRKAPVSGQLAYLDPALSDASKRMADAMTMHWLAGSAGHWVAFKLADGTSPDRNTAYETRIECVKHQKWDRDNIVYLEVVPGGMEPKEAGAFLQWARFLHSQGWRLPDPEFNFDNGMPDSRADRLAMARHLISGGK